MDQTSAARGTSSALTHGNRLTRRVGIAMAQRLCHPEARLRGRLTDPELDQLPVEAA
jgi:hypothetical protein